MGRVSGWEWLIILAVLLLLFGARKLPELARSLGASAKEFRKGIEAGSEDDGDDAGATDAAPETAQATEDT
jgi:sec-independent protein translocase protein TatA